jgi:exosortase/archaeosortase family protein
MIDGASIEAVVPRRFAAGRLTAALGLALAGLAAIESQPACGAALAPLRVLTAQLTAALLAAGGLPVVRQAQVLVHAGGFACAITTACTALTPAALLVAAVMSQPRPWRERIAGAATGVGLVVVVNQVRLVTLVWLGVRAPGLFDAAHGFLWPALLALATAACGIAWLAAPCRGGPCIANARPAVPQPQC